MEFLIDASLPRDVSKVLAQHGHQGIDVRDIGLRSAADSIIAAHAIRHRMALISADFDFADIRNDPPAEYFGIVVIAPPRDSTVSTTLLLVARFLTHTELLANLTGRLAIVDERRIRIRPPLP